MQMFVIIGYYHTCNHKHGLFIHDCIKTAGFSGSQFHQPNPQKFDANKRKKRYNNKIVINNKPQQNTQTRRTRAMSKNYTYTDAGVDREQRHESKKALKNLEETYKRALHGQIMHLPYGNIFPQTDDSYLDLVVEGVGTKVLLAQLADKHDTIGIDAVAMAVNDVIRSGAKPLALADNIHAQVSNPELVKQWLKGIAQGAIEADCPVPSGEIGDVAEIIQGITDGAGFDMVVASIGQVAKERIITGKDNKPGDPIIGLRSSGLHSNGITLARKILFKKWGGKHDAYAKIDGLDRELVFESLEPTRIYVKPFLQTTKEIAVKAAVHITGDAYLKFNNLAHFSTGIGFEFTNFKPQPIFHVIQETAAKLGLTISNEEMFRTFNMGWGFAIIVAPTDEDNALSILKKAGAEAQHIGNVTGKQTVEIHYGGKQITLKE
jgi:phosphoribosylformylglycinamidine cyclo-ligase